jgi:hypothetical protein
MNMRPRYVPSLAALSSFPRESSQCVPVSRMRRHSARANVLARAGRDPVTVMRSATGSALMRGNISPL